MGLSVACPAVLLLLLVVTLAWCQPLNTDPDTTSDLFARLTSVAGGSGLSQRLGEEEEEEGGSLLGGSAPWYGYHPHPHQHPYYYTHPAAYDGYAAFSPYGGYSLFKKRKRMVVEGGDMDYGYGYGRSGYGGAGGYPYAEYPYSFTGLY